MEYPLKNWGKESYLCLFLLIGSANTYEIAYTFLSISYSPNQNTTEELCKKIRKESRYKEYITESLYFTLQKENIHSIKRRVRRVEIFVSFPHK